MVFILNIKWNNVYLNISQSWLLFSTCYFFVDWSHKLKVHRANLKMVPLYHVRFSTDTINKNSIFFLLFFFDFCCFSIFFGFFCFLFVCVFFCVKQKLYVLIQIQPCRQVSDKKFSPGWFPEMFWPYFFHKEALENWL